MKTAKGSPAKKAVTPVRKGAVNKKVIKKPVAKAMTKKAVDNAPKKAAATPTGAIEDTKTTSAKKKPVAVRRQNTRLKKAQNSNNEEESEITDEAGVGKTPHLTAVEDKCLSEETQIEDAGHEAALEKEPPKDAVDMVPSGSKGPADSIDQVKENETASVGTSSPKILRSTPVRSSSGSKEKSDGLKVEKNRSIFSGKKEEKSTPGKGEKKLSGDIGAFMANFFSRRRELEKASASSGCNKESKSGGTVQSANSTNNEVQHEDNKADSVSSVGLEEKGSEMPRKENQINDGDEAKKDGDQHEKRGGGKSTTDEKSSGKSGISSAENQAKDKVTTTGENTALSDTSKCGNITSLEKGTEEKVHRGVGALLAGLGNRKSQYVKDVPPLSSGKGGPVVACDDLSKEKILSSEEGKSESEASEKNLPDSSLKDRKEAQEFGNKGMSPRKTSLVKSGDVEKNNCKSPEEKELPSEKANVKRAAASRKGKTPRVSAMKSEDDHQDNIESKVTGSIGALLAGLGSRQQKMPESKNSPLSRGKGEIYEINQFAADENKSRQSKMDEAEKEKEKNEISEVNQVSSHENTTSDSKSKVNESEKEGDKATDLGVESKKIQSLGSLLAGLSNRRQQFMSSDQPSSSGESKISKGNQFVADEDKSDKPKVDESEKERSKVPKPRSTSKADDQDIESKKIQSLGSLLAGLGSRKQEFMSSGKQMSSEESKVSKGNQYLADENRSDKSKVDESEKERAKIPKPRSASKADGQDNDSKKRQSLGTLLAGLGNRKQEFMGFSKPTSSGESRISKANQFVADENRNDKSKVDEFERERFQVPKPRSTSKSEGPDIESKKIQSLGSLLTGLGSRKQEFMSPDKQSSSDSREDGRRMSESNRRFGDFGFVKDKIPRNKKRSWEFSEDDRNESNYSGKSKRTEESVVREENDVIYVRGHVPKPKPSEKDLQNQNKSLQGNMSFEEEAERRKTHCIGNLLASLANRPFPDTRPPSNNNSTNRPFLDPRPSSSNNSYSYGQGRQWNRGRGEKEFRKRRRDDYDDEDDEDDGRDRRWRERDTNKQGIKEKKEKEPFDPKKAAEMVKSETERLEKEYGPGVFSVGFTESRILAFVCEICSVQLTKSTLEVHADGMQHLKKKNLWEKKKRIQKANSEEKITYSGGRTGWVKVDSESEKSASATPSPAPSSSAGDGSYGYEGSYGQGGYGYNKQLYKQPPPYSSGPVDRSGGQYGTGPANNPPLAIPGHINTAVPPPPPPAAEPPAKPKNTKGGATVSLLQRLDACAVKSEKDLDLASSVISALLKSLKEFNHKRGDTKFIEVLTEIDIKFRSLRAKSALSTYEKSAKDGATSTSSSVQSSTPQSGYSSAPSYDNSSKDNSSGTWYSQGRGHISGNSSAFGQGKSTGATEAVGSSYSNKISEGYASGAGSSQVMSSRYSSQPPPANIPPVSSTGYSQQTAKHTQGTDGAAGTYNAATSYYSSGYSAQTDGSMKQMDSKIYSSEKPKETVGGYYTQGPAVSQPVYPGYSEKTGNTNVMEIIRSGNEPPPPPPPESNYAAQGYHSSYPPMGYYNLSAPPPNYNHPPY
ncbi:uncharacterized protein LOC135207292 isoform X2 [Macrobrachium nipponense]|uniref:uncharacterized protein LOC135207292 isoform X2 n=1 Tax=Macrobrachium nipponense TaxID=159736 RepID=UPI0030C85778